jgi:hypothetical protein
LSKIEVNTVEPQCGTTLTLGASGDTVTLGSGASQSGFGRTGTVDWQTTKKTGNFTAVSGEGYFVDTSSGAITATFPASPSAGDIVGFNDYARNFATNNLTIDRNGSNIQGVATNATIATNGRSTMFVYVDATKGWIPTEDQTVGDYGALYVTATGGTITTCGDFKIHTFTGPGTFTVSCAGNPAGSTTVDYLVVAGGGGGGTSYGGGGGAGGLRASATTYTNSGPSAPLTPTSGPTAVSALPVTATGYPVTVGGGGNGSTGPTCANSTKGSNSVFAGSSTITSAGGGAGARTTNGSPGGSGGGGSVAGGSGCGTTGTGNTPPVTPPQGQNGGNAICAPPGYGSGGGGGGIAVGANGTAPVGGAGGAGGGFPSAFGTSGENCGSFYYFSGGGGGGAYSPTPSGAPPGVAGGVGGGGRSNVTAGTAGTTNTGGGGGGGSSATPAGHNGGNGGSGIVIIRYKFQ